MTLKGNADTTITTTTTAAAANTTTTVTTANNSNTITNINTNSSTNYVDFQDDEMAIAAKLTQAEVAAVRLYTGPIYVPWNTALRMYKENPLLLLEWQTSISILYSAVFKLSFLSKPGKVYRYYYSSSDYYYNYCYCYFYYYYYYYYYCYCY